MLQPYIESANALSDMNTNTDYFTPLALHARGKNMIFCMCAVFLLVRSLHSQEIKTLNSKS